MIIVTELMAEHQQVLGVVRQHVFPGQTDTTVQLNTLVGDETGSAYNQDFGRSQGATALVAVRCISHAGGQNGH
ncbi:hypothetical protein D3C76_1723410 [compost metagenome]